MLYLRSDLLIINDSLPWFYVKIIFLIGLFIYHYWCWKKVLEIKNLNGKELPTANLKLRQSNEIATFLLFLVVFIAILKSLALEYWWQLIVGFFVIVFVIMMTVKLVNKKK
jgi:putative membrane protein